MLVRELDERNFVKQLGPFVLVERPYAKEEVSTGAPKVTQPLRKATKRRASVLDFEDLWVATLPPMSQHDVFSIGRSPDCDVVLDEGTVSKHNARIHWSNDQAELEDLGSSNGTLLNGKKLAASARLRLGDNDAIDFGNVQVYYLECITLRTRLRGKA